MPDVFLSYSRHDSEAMRGLCTDLVSHGYDVWTDQTGLRAGSERWQREIASQIEKAKCVVVLLSPEAKESRWVGREITYAQEFEVPIIPLMLRGDNKASVPITLVDVNWIDMRETYDLAKLLDELDFYVSGETSGQNHMRCNLSTDRTYVDRAWVESKRAYARQAVEKHGYPGYFEAHLSLAPPKPVLSHARLYDLAKQSQVNTFGWPLALVMEREGARPRPVPDGIDAEVAPQDHDSYDYWSINLSGDVYLLTSLFEDRHSRANPGTVLFFNTQISRVTELLQYCEKFYAQVAVADSRHISISLAYGGLHGRILGTSNPNRIWHPRSQIREDEYCVTQECSLSLVRSGKSELVRSLLHDLFILFDFAELPDSVYEGIVSDFLQGKVT